LTEIFKKGGFDAVIGNPPYLGGREWKDEFGRRYDYFVDKFEVCEYQFDIYVLFWELGIKILNSSGIIGLITPNTWLNNLSNKKLRSFILQNTNILSIVDYSNVKVFHEAVVLPIITILGKTKSTNHRVDILIADNFQPRFSHQTPQKYWSKDNHSIINISLFEEDIRLKAKIEKSSTELESCAVVRFGIKIYETGKGDPPQKASFAKDHIYEASEKKSINYRKYLEGKDINRYQINYQNRWLKYGKNLAAPRDPLLFEGERLLFRRIMGNRLIGVLTSENYVTSQLLQIVKPNNEKDSFFLLGILNSSLMAYYFRKKYNRQDKTFPEIRLYELKSLPIRIVDLDNPKLVENREHLSTRVHNMLLLNKRTPQTPFEREQFEREIAATDAQIDKLVYELYGLTEEEIMIVEGEG